MNIAAETKREIQRMLDAGMEKLTRSDCESQLDALGYRIDPVHSFNYINTGNAISYAARAIHLVDKKTRRSFAHVDGKRDADFDALQKMRFNCFVVSGNRIWEL